MEEVIEEIVTPGASKLGYQPSPSTTVLQNSPGGALPPPPILRKQQDKLVVCNEAEEGELILSNLTAQAHQQQPILQSNEVSSVTQVEASIVNTATGYPIHYQKITRNIYQIPSKHKSRRRHHCDDLSDSDSSEISCDDCSRSRRRRHKSHNKPQDSLSRSTSREPSDLLQEDHMRAEVAKEHRHRRHRHRHCKYSSCDSSESDDEKQSHRHYHRRHKYRRKRKHRRREPQSPSRLEQNIFGVERYESKDPSKSRHHRSRKSRKSNQETVEIIAVKNKADAKENIPVLTLSDDEQTNLKVKKELPSPDPPPPGIRVEPDPPPPGLRVANADNALIPSNKIKIEPEDKVPVQVPALPCNVKVKQEPKNVDEIPSVMNTPPASPQPDTSKNM